MQNIYRRKLEWKYSGGYFSYTRYNYYLAQWCEFDPRDVHQLFGTLFSKVSLR